MSKWDAAAERVKGVSSEATGINALLLSTKSAIIEKKREFVKQGTSYTAVDFA